MRDRNASSILRKLRNLLIYTIIFTIIGLTGACASKKEAKEEPILTGPPVTLSDTEQLDPADEQLESTSQDGSNFNYSGYMDLNPSFAEDCPRYDYDGDGIPDRVYKEYKEENGLSYFYMHFGNGEKLFLADNQWGGIFFESEAVDLTGDGVNEILFEQMSLSTKCQNLYLYVFTLRNGTYERMELPYYGTAVENNEVDSMLYLPLIMKKVDDEAVSIYQPDTEYQSLITTENHSHEAGDTFNEMEHLYFEELEGKVTYYQASTIQIVDTKVESKKGLLFQAYLGDKWCTKSVSWKLEYLDKEWRITGIYQSDPIRIELETAFSGDLNGDNLPDTVCYGTQIIKENDYEYEMPHLEIDGTEFDYQYLENKYGIYIVSCSKIGYYIVDIDNSDPYREIAILDEGPSSDPVSYFFRYDGKGLIYCGSITDFPGNETFYAPGDGSMRASKRLSILQTWFAEATWKLNEQNYLEEQPADIYYPYQYATDESTTNYAQSDLKLYLNPDKNSPVVTIKKGEIIRLTATDDKNWVQVTGDSGFSGWFYLQEDNQIDLPSGNARIGDVVTYLNMAD